MNLQQIRQLAERDRYEEAILECDRLLATNSGPPRIDVLRMRAYVHSLRGDYATALQDRKAIIGSGQALLKDYYQAGESALFSGESKQASRFFEEVLRRSEAANETWFTDASYFLLSVAEMNQGKFSSAEAALDKAVLFQPGIAMQLPQICGELSHQQLREEIRRRQAHSTRE